MQPRSVSQVDEITYENEFGSELHLLYPEIHGSPHLVDSKLSRQRTFQVVNSADGERDR